MGRVCAAATEFKKGFDQDYESIIFMTPLN